MSNTSSGGTGRKDVDVLYFRELLSGVATNSAYLDGLMKPYLSRQLEELGQLKSGAAYRAV